jgi:Mrp family chromosome partitioning ATPase
MNLLDQAFIKAYTQRGAASTAVPLPAARPVLREEAVASQPDPKAAAGAAKASLDSVLAAVSEPPTKRLTPVPPSPPGKPPGTVADRPGVSAGSVPAFLRAGSTTKKRAGKEKDSATPAPTLGGTGLVGSVHRVDRGRASATNSAAESGHIPSPHLSLVAPELGDETAATSAEGPTGAEAAQSGRAGTGGEAFRPLLQVDRFTWPRPCSRLVTAAAGELDRLSDELLAVQARGQKVLAIAGCRRGEGSTTVLLCTARRLAERGLRVVMVDADLADPQLARRLGVLPQFGWESAWAGRLPLAEVVIESAENRLALLPLREASAAVGPWGDGKAIIAENIDTLRANFDLVLVDLGPLEDPAVIGGSFGREVSRRLDGVILVQNVRLAARERLAEVQRRLAAAGIAQAGIVENLVRPACTRPTGS